MKRTTIHISAALALLLGLAACTQDEAGLLPEGAEGTPIVFTATGLNPTATATAGTRATVDGNWEGVETVAVLINGEVKDYDVNPSATDNTSATLTSTDPHYWSNYDNIAVTAWWPYTAGETTPPVVKVAENQHNLTDYQNSDFISAENQTVEFGSPTLRFTHRTARITVALTDYTEGLVSVKLTDLSTENGNPAEIIPYDKGNDTYTALVAPQTVAAGTTFVTCTFDNGKDFVYKMQNDAEWKAGEEYTYTVSLAAANDLGYTVSADGKTYTVYNGNGLKNVADVVDGGETDINITLANDIDLTGIEWTPIGTDENNSYNGTFDGNGKTITGLTVNQPGKNHVALFRVVSERGMVKDVRLENVNISASDKASYVGGIAGENVGTIENCSVSGSISGISQVGGIAGGNFGTIAACTATVSVSAAIEAGGIVGESMNGAIIACTATGSVLGKDYYVGGIAGCNTNATVTACYHATGNVSGNSEVGGVMGSNINGTVTACYWSDYNGNGIGLGSGEATKVDGTTVTWTDAIDGMNTALQSAGSEWRYELTGELPTLKKQ